ncbi:MAG: TIGR00297 family protein [Kaiparowitsia implicata GSE-PSE-MK54-09C]|jgi:uncharacterized protein (TIGR00297 family)|nr:TIGR00297 family protein [Kaiparowitsia implicata GSE-PSE-MK54-09C]
MDALLPWGVAIALNSFLLAIAWVAPKALLTPQGLLHAWVLGIVIWGTLGWRGYVVMLTYFALGTAVTRIGKARKEALGIAEKRSGVRGPENVWGSALAGTLCALGAYLFAGRIENLPLVAALVLAYVASLSTKLADTCGSEVGKAYGKRTFLITTFQPVPAGTEGAISLEGTLAGLVGGLAIALVGYGLGLISSVGIGICLVAAFIATNLESVIGATYQSKYRWLTNEMVNIINTAIGAAIALLIGLVWR